MRPALPVLLLLLLDRSVTAQQRVLHFTRTSGFDHGTRTVSAAMFQSIATDLGVLVDDDATAAPFSDPAMLAQYDVIVFSNTSGDAILSAPQRANFEQWVAGGGHVMGIHAATDTYRHGTANGSNTGAWDFYAELIGASVQQNPNHVSGTPLYAMEHVGTHASTASLPDPWPKNEEYYYWEGGYFGPDNVEVLRVEETIGPNNQVNSYDAPRPMSWYRLLPGGNKVFYTALGHATSNYTADTLFRAHISDALAWLLEPITGIGEATNTTAPSVHPNPVSSTLSMHATALPDGTPVLLRDLSGRTIAHAVVHAGSARMDVHATAPGLYLLTAGGHSVRVVVEP